MKKTYIKKNIEFIYNADQFVKFDKYEDLNFYKKKHKLC
jgi:hypothetical protein